MSAKVMVISREYGSNGRKIGKELAKRLGIHFYDKELIQLASEKNNIPYEELIKVDEKRSSPWRYPSDDEFQMEARFRFEPMNDVLFDTQESVIKELAKKEDCIIVGRCANHILAGKEGCISVYIHAPLKKRIETIIDRTSLNPAESKNLIKKVDKQRKYYYNYFTDKKWNDIEEYDFCMDSSRYTVEQAAIILEAIYRNCWRKDGEFGAGM